VVRYEWDEAKSDANLLERGFDFAFATLVFDEKILVVADKRRDYGEARFVAVGRADGLHLTVVFTDREDSTGELIRRIISARRSSRRERRMYDEATP
jgi:uncharacterized DUF497 family protein